MFFAPFRTTSLKAFDSETKTQQHRHSKEKDDGEGTDNRTVDCKPFWCVYEEAHKANDKCQRDGKHYKDT